MDKMQRVRWLLLIALACTLPGVGMALAPSAQAYALDQAARGAALYNDRCSTCHGDVGQGLTDEFRSTWAVGDRNCWIPACHGPNPPKPGGFTLPRVVPALVGPGTLTRFADAQALHGFIKAAMPMQEPGVLTDDEYWELTAFLLRENGVAADGKAVDAANAAQVAIPRSGQPVPRPNRTAIPRAAMPARERAPMAQPTRAPSEQQAVAEVAPAASPSQAPAGVPARPASAANPALWTVLLVLVLVGMIVWRKRSQLRS